MTKGIISQGAEALIIKNKDKVTKQRTPKSYRLSILDQKLRTQRTRKEAKLLEKASKLIPVPKIIKSSDKSMEIEMEFIDGKKLSDNLDKLENAEEICEEIGRNLAKIHDSSIIHGDLTTSNMILNEKDNKVYFIDFGLGYESNKSEDKAVDLHLIKQALEAKHFLHHQDFFKAIIKGYKTSKHSKEVLNRLDKVEKRGRYKQAY